MRVITELVLNHTSSEHPWFQRARRAPPGSPRARLLRVERHAGALQGHAHHLQGLRDVELGVGSGREGVLLAPLLLAPARSQLRQPRGPRGAVQASIDFWLELGVDGMRLDAVPYLYEREGTNCENLPETHAFLKQLRTHIDAQVQEPHAARRGQPVARGRRRVLRRRRRVPHELPLPADAAHVHGDRSWRIAFPIVDILDQTPKIPPSCQWATFLRNHDELTLEMVTDEDRDYDVSRLRRAIANARINLGIRRRLAPLLEACAARSS